MSRAKRDKDINTANNRLIRSCKRDIIYMDGQDEQDGYGFISARLGMGQKGSNALNM